MAAKKTAKKTTPETMSKAAFVRSLPATTPAKEVVEKAKAAGISLAESYVYNVRQTDREPKKAKTSAKKATKSPPTTPSKAPVRSPAPSRVEDLLRAVAAELGLARAMEILGAERARVRAVLGG